MTTNPKNKTSAAVEAADKPAGQAVQAGPAGRVVLVGAGPGDPGLITATGLARLRAAEVVVYDALANPALLDQAPPEAQRIDVGKRARQHKLKQDQINELLRDRAAAGHLVVRLKGGDPYLFGRGAEEATYLGQHAIPCEVVPGITAGIAAPAAAGVPVTHRGHASTVTFVTGHEDPAKTDAAVDYAALARLVAAGGTVCFYMGVGRLAAIRDALTAHGLDPAAPVALVQWGTLPRQRQVRGTLETIAGEVQRAALGPPAIIVVGAVAGLREPGLEGFIRRPLFGQSVLIARTRQQASVLRQRLEALGAEVFEAPTIQITPPPSWDAVDDALRQVGDGDYDWLVLTSPNGVAAAADRLDAMGRDSRRLAPVRIAAVGDATAQALRQRLAVTPDLVPTRYVGESLAGELIAEHDAANQRFLLLRADIARPTLPRKLTDAGAEVTEVAAYQTRKADALPQGVVEALRERRIGWAAFTSASTARNLADLLGDDLPLLEPLRIATIGPTTSQAVGDLNLTVTTEAARSNLDGLIQALVRKAGPRDEGTKGSGDRVEREQEAEGPRASHSSVFK